MKLVVVSDVHAHPFAAFSSGSGAKNERLQIILRALRHTLEEARSRDGYWLCAGDLIHTTGHALHEVSTGLTQVFSEFPDVQKICIVGNHDSRGVGGAVTVEDSFLFTLANAVDNFHVLDNDSYQVPEGPTVHGFTAQPDVNLLIEQIEQQINNRSGIALLHAMVIGSDFGTGVSAQHGLDPDFLLEKFNLSIVGDIHKPTLHQEDGRAILVPGSLVPHNFGEVGSRGYWVIDVEETSEGWVVTNFEDKESDAPQFITVDDPEEVKDDGNYYRVRGGKKGDLPENAVVVSSSPTVVESRDLLEGAQNRRDILQRWLEIEPPEGRFADRYLGEGLEILKRQDAIVPQKARIKRVEGENFFSYEKLEYDVQEGVHLVIGHSEDFSSNGAGKSSLLESIFWALFNKTTKGVSAADVIRWGESSCYVTVEMELNGKPLVVTRSRTSSSIDLEVVYNGEEVSAATNTELSEKLQAMIGFTPELFKALGYFSQEDLTLLSRATDSELKDVLADLRGLSAYQDAAEEAGQLARSAEEKMNKYSSKVDTLTEEIYRDEESIVELKSKIQKWDDEKEKRVEELEVEKKKKENQLQEVKEDRTERSGRITERAFNLLDQAKEKREILVSEFEEEFIKKEGPELEKKFSEACEEFNKVRQDLGSNEDTETEMVEELHGNLKTDISNLETKARNAKSAVQKASQAVQSYTNKIEEKKKSIENVQSGEVKTCPTCQQPLQSHSSVEEVTNKLKKEVEDLEQERNEEERNLESSKQEVEELQENLSQAKDKFGRVQELLELLKQRDRLQNKIEKLETQKKNLQETSHARAETKAEKWISRRKERIKERSKSVLNELDKRVDRAERELEKVEASLKSWREKENPHQSAMKQTKKSLQERKKERWRSHRREREEELDQELYAYWQSAFGKTGLQSLLLEDLTSLFNKHRGDVFPLLTHGKYDVQMSAISRTQQGDVREKAEYRVFKDGKEVPYANLSGGQRRRVDLGVLLTMTLAASKTHGIPGALGIMVLDEVASYLDEDGAEALADTLKSYCPDVVPSIFVVSQDTSHKALYSKVITVVQDENGVSSVV